MLSSSIQIIVAFMTVIFSKAFNNHLINEFKELYNDTGEQMWLDNITQYENIGMSVIMVTGIIVIVLNFITLYNLLNKSSDKINTKLIMFLSIISIIITESNIILFLSLLNIVLCLERNKKKPEKREDLPLKQHNIVNKKTKLHAIIVILVYFLLPEFIALLPFSVIALSLILDVILIKVCIICFWEELKTSFVIFRENIKKYLKFILNKQWIMFIVYYITLMMIYVIKGTASEPVNQEMLEQLSLLYLIPSCLIYAPLVEELVFRGAIKKLIKNDRLFIVISGVIFGLLHAINEATILDIVLFSLPYSVIGCYLAYLYVRTDNIYCSITGHFIHNAFACILMLLS